MKQFKPCANFAQDFTTAEKAQARANIDAASTSVATHISDGLMSAADKLKLDTMGSQVQSDWLESEQSSPAYIKNKPAIPAAQVNSDWSSNSGVSQILNKPESKYWMWDVGGNVESGDWNDSTWTTVTGIHNAINLIPNFTDVNGQHIHTNFDSDNPEAFKSRNDSAWIYLTKGLWHYTMELEVECTVAGTGRTDLTLLTHEQRGFDYIRVRLFYTAFNPILTHYTRSLSGIIYVDQDPQIVQGSWEGTTLKFQVSWDNDTDSEFRIRQQSLQLHRLGV